jgi:transposase-like protein
MGRIVFGILSLSQHLEELAHSPQRYRPAACPHCGLKAPRAHGVYYRKADRQGQLNPVPLPRFRCAGCQRTCSRLPQCLSPRRWHDWGTQQQVLEVLLVGGSQRAAADAVGIARRTVGRWWSWLQGCGERFRFHLASRFPEWSRSGEDLRTFLRAVLLAQPLSEAMAWLDHDGVVVP